MRIHRDPPIDATIFLCIQLLITHPKEQQTRRPKPDQQSLNHPLPTSRFQHQQSWRLKNNGLFVALLLCWCISSYDGALSAPPPPSQQQQQQQAGGEGGAAGSPGASNGIVGGGEVAFPLKDSSSWLKAYEPSCDELRAMWRFSKRQSRAAEVTNEIPTYRGDPFRLNFWQPNKVPKQVHHLLAKNHRYKYDRLGKMMRNPAAYYARSGAAAMMPMSFMGPVYGRVVHKEPELDFGIPRQQPAAQSQQLPRRVQYRFPGPSPNGAGQNNNAVVARMSGSPASPMNMTPQRGSFQKLKELVWTERARELATQRRNEEMMARAAVLKELANGGHRLVRPDYSLSVYLIKLSSQMATHSPDYIVNSILIRFSNPYHNPYSPSIEGAPYYSSANTNNGQSGIDYNTDPDEDPMYDSMQGGGGGGGPKIPSHFRERNSFLLGQQQQLQQQQQQQQEQQMQQQQQQSHMNSKINFPNKHSRLY